MGQKSGMLGIIGIRYSINLYQSFNLMVALKSELLKEPESQGCSQAKNWHRHSTRNGLATGASQTERVGKKELINVWLQNFSFGMVVADQA